MSMKALLLKAYGAPKDALVLETIAMPAFDESSDQVLIRVIAASINPVDYHITKGGFKGFLADPKPDGVGFELSGIVEKVGVKAQGFRPGHEVFGSQGAQKGSMAEYISLSSRMCALKPASVSHEEAACLPIGGITALQALALHKGEKDVALIPAGMGGVGALAIQLAKNYFGFKKVITTVSTDKLPLIKTAVPCVDEVIDYKTTSLESAIPPKSVDFVLDDIRDPESFIPFLNTEHNNSTLVSVNKGLDPDEMAAWWEVKVPPPMRAMLEKNIKNLKEKMPSGTAFYGLLGEIGTKDLETLGKLADEGLLKPIIYKVFPLDQAVEAFEMFGTGKVHGKIVIKVADA